MLESRGKGFEMQSKRRKRKKNYWQVIGTYKYLLLAFAVLFAFLIMFRPHMALTLILTVITAATVYFRTRYQLPIDFTPTVFCPAIIILVAGVPSLVFYILFGVAIPTIATGLIGPDAFLFWGLMLGINLVVPFLSGLHIIILGLAICLIKMVVCLTTNQILGIPFSESIIVEITHFVLNMVLFIRFGEFVLALAGI